MTTPTTNLKLTTYNAVTDASALFQTFRENIAGDSAVSNMSIIDAWAGSVSGSIASISGFTGINVVSASYVSENFYASSASVISAYSRNMQMSLILDTTNTGTVTLNINSLGTKTLNKIDSSGNKVNFTGRELIKNKPNSFVYDGTNWVWMGASSADQIYASGSQNNLMMIGASGVLTTSGINASSIALVTGSYIVLALNSNLSNEWLLSAGSGISLTQNSDASTITISSFVSSSAIAPSNGSYVVLSLNPSLSNEWLLTAGNNVTLTQNTSTSTIIIDTTLSASSIATTGSYVMLSLHPNITGEWLLTEGDNIKITQNASASTVTIDTVVAASSIAPSTASYVLLEIDSSLQKGLVLTAGSNISIAKDTLSGTVKVNSIPFSGSYLTGIVPIITGGTGTNSASGIRNAIGLGTGTGALGIPDGGTGATTASNVRSNLSVAPSTGSYVVLSLNNELSNEWLLTAGSNITLEQNSSASTLIVSTTAGSGNMSTKNMYTQQVTLYSGSWVTKEQSVSVTNMTSDAIVQYGAEPSTSTNRDAFFNADVYCSAQSTGSLTFNYTASASPTTDIAVNVMFIV